MFVHRREVTKRDDVRQLSDAELYEQAAQAAEAIGEPEFAMKIRRMAQS
jgi:hypothetical protein